MKRLNHRSRNRLSLHLKLKIHQYIMLLILSVTLVTAIVLFALIRSYTNQILTEQHLQRYLAYAHQYFELNISDMMENIYMELAPLHLNSNLDLQFSHASNREEAYEVLQSEVNKIVENSEWISGIRLIDNDGMTYDFAKENQEIDDEINIDFISTISAYDLVLAPEIVEDDSGDAFLVFGSEWTNYNNSYKSGNILVFVPHDKVLHTYLDSILSGGSIYITLHDTIISSSDPSTLGKRMFLPTEMLTENSFELENAETEKYFLNTYALQTTHQLHLNMTTFVSKNYFYQTMENYNIISFALFFVVILISIVAAYLISTRLSRSIENFTTRIGYQELTARKFSGEANNEIIMLEKRFYTFVNEIDSLIEQNREANRQKQEAEFTALQAQINPHFLYNTLESISGMAKIRRQPEIQKACVALGRFFRLSLQKGEYMVPVENEINHVKSYITIEQIRFPNKFEVIFDIDEELYRYRMPKILLQPIVENAIHHAFNKIRRKGSIRIIGKIEGDYILFRIEDNGLGLRGVNPLEPKETDAGPSISGYGLYNVHKRIQLEYGTECGLFFEETPGGGTTVIIRLKKSA